MDLNSPGNEEEEENVTSTEVEVAVDSVPEDQSGEDSAGENGPIPEANSSSAEILFPTQQKSYDYLLKVRLIN